MKRPENFFLRGFVIKAGQRGQGKECQGIRRGPPGAKQGIGEGATKAGEIKQLDNGRDSKKDWKGRPKGGPRTYPRFKFVEKPMEWHYQNQEGEGSPLYNWPTGQARKQAKPLVEAGVIVEYIIRWAQGRRSTNGEGNTLVEMTKGFRQWLRNHCTPWIATRGDTYATKRFKGELEMKSYFPWTVQNQILRKNAAWGINGEGGLYTKERVVGKTGLPDKIKEFRRLCALTIRSDVRENVGKRLALLAGKTCCSKGNQRSITKKHTLGIHSKKYRETTREGESERNGLRMGIMEIRTGRKIQ